jgi:hypothetical protein
MTYYFISYQWNHYVEGSSYTAPKWNFGEVLTTDHPVKWLVDTRDEYSVTEDCGKRIISEYVLIGWQEVSKEIYDMYEGEVG